MPFLDLPDCVNARDLGGTPLIGGGSVRANALLRSDNHDLLTEAGIAAVRGLGVRRIIDLRHGWEADEFPSPFRDDEIYLNLPLLGVYPGFDPTAPDDYRPEVDHAPERVAAAFIALAEAPAGPVLVHCHAGRDRAGIMTALALAVAGAAHDVIVADYALTEGAEAKTMQDLLDHFDSEHGGVSAYLQKAGVESRHLEAVRRRLAVAG
ncbi:MULTISPECIES: tyrosine-protein phosphatase [Glycomyces]|uniref:Protein tyrosine/serine phosphatase n=2 Tax=Glycomyces TaxID=58113 RepID=A0A9X3PGV9_9ACTN|nr:tyrosine-protein phosphatase [Glycomyces lechevalierae]MDA1385254.1 tyrosine-protein phosphatase [Glycomyces lechevalierae]MDR7337129.1 protein tyrosine/serine phosphatase [Glycomyces lechevalierae]